MKCSALARPLFAPLLVAGAVAGVNAHAEDLLGDAIAKGKVNLELRYRLENVDQESASDKEAFASTLRTRLRYATGEWAQLSALVELDNVSRIGEDRYNDTRNGKTQYPTVVDPDGGDLNQALVKYVGIANTPVTVGRQRVNLDNQRWIGSVGWRQNEQTLDAGVVEFKGVDRLTVTYAYVTGVNRINGPEQGTPPAIYESDSTLLNAKYVVGPALTAVGYAYALDFDNAAASSNRTVGVRATGKVPVGEFNLTYAGELARQADNGDNAADYDAAYGLAEVGFGKGAWEVQAGYEMLGSDDGVAAVQAPLATLHKFQGWADKFLTTPANGLVDVYGGATYTVNGYGFTVAYHQYDAEEGNADYGSEVDAQVAKTFAKRYTLTFKYANFSDGEVAAYTDTKKAWLMAEAKF